MKKILFVSWHGLGDNIMMTPALRKYKKLNPDTYIAVAGLKRFGNTLIELLSGLNFIDEIIPCLPDSWNDFNDYNQGVTEVINIAKKVGEEKGFDKLCVLPTQKLEGYKFHKIFRFAEEMNIEFEYLDELHTELSTTKEAEKDVEKFLEQIPKPILIFHAMAGNSVKTLCSEDSEVILDRFKEYSILEFGRQSTDRSILIPEDNMEFSKALIKKADKVVAIDSVVMHIAGAFKKNISAIFTETPIHQAIPISQYVEVIGIDNEKVQLHKWSDYKEQIFRDFLPAPSNIVKHTSGKITLPPNYYHRWCYWANMLTFRCNAKCPFCIVDSRGKHVDRLELSGKEIIKWWNSIEHNNYQNLSLIGGEAILHPDIIEIVNSLEKYRITITTNCKGEFWESQFRNFKPKNDSTLRINTSYHPHAISPDVFIDRIFKMREFGLYVDRADYVYTPDIMLKYEKEIEQVNKVIPLQRQTFAGFYNNIDKLNAEYKPENLCPNKEQHNGENECLLYEDDDYEFYKDMCGQEKRKTVRCKNGLLSLIISPDGWYHACHYKLYYNIDGISNIKDFKPISENDFYCNYYGYCNWCDFVRSKIANKIKKNSKNEFLINKK